MCRSEPIARVHRYVLVGCIVLWGLVRLPGVCSASQTDTLARATLQGLPGIAVRIADLPDEIERAGLTKEQLQTDVELRLRQSGIPVFTGGENIPTLNVILTIFRHNIASLYIYAIEVAVLQPVLLARNGSPAFGNTWDHTHVGAIGAAKLSEVRNVVRDQVDKFMNAYLSVNPRTPGKGSR